MNANKIRAGMNIVTCNELSSAKGMLVDHTLTAARATYARGKVLGAVPGHGGDIWLVRHGPASIFGPRFESRAVYSYNELLPASQPTPAGKGKKTPRGLAQYIRACKSKGKTPSAEAQALLMRREQMIR